MKITDLLSKESVLLNADVNDKEACLVKLVDLMDASGKISDKKSYLDAVHEREKEGTTGVGNGIAIPHGRCSGVKEPGLAAMTIPSGVEYNALDSKPVDLAFLIAAPEGSGSMHLEILSKLATMLMDENFVADLKKAKTVEEFLKVIDDAEDKIGKVIYNIQRIAASRHRRRDAAKAEGSSPSRRPIAFFHLTQSCRV